jgi:hypothetical protein
VRDVHAPIDFVASPFGPDDESGPSADSDPVVDELKAATLRSRVDVAARIVSLTANERPIRYVDVVVDDGTGRLRCRFFGRAMVGGFEKGRGLRVSGRITLHLGCECVCNPLYELLDAPEDGVASS